MAAQGPEMSPDVLVAETNGALASVDALRPRDELEATLAVQIAICGRDNAFQTQEADFSTRATTLFPTIDLQEVAPTPNLSFHMRLPLGV
jgi:hypothetical protein